MFVCYNSIQAVLDIPHLFLGDTTFSDILKPERVAYIFENIHDGLFNE